MSLVRFVSKLFTPVNLTQLAEILHYTCKKCGSNSKYYLLGLKKYFKNGGMIHERTCKQYKRQDALLEYKSIFI